jgi:hypothetical protein
MNKFVILATYRDLIEAEIVKGHLESEGIQCVLEDNNTVAANPLYSNAIGGVKLKVWPEDYDKALSIIGQSKDTTTGDADALSGQLSAPVKSSKGILIFVATILIAVAFLYLIYIKVMKSI